MTAKKTPEPKALVPVQPPQLLSTAEILAHPVVREMSARLETIQGLLQNLPRLVGEAVAAANQVPHERSFGPPVPLIAPLGEVEIHKRKLVVDGKTFRVKPAKKESPREIRKPR